MDNNFLTNPLLSTYFFMATYSTNKKLIQALVITYPGDFLLKLRI